jgi:hypothetical protein
MMMTPKAMIAKFATIFAAMLPSEFVARLVVAVHVLGIAGGGVDAGPGAILFVDESGNGLRPFPCLPLLLLNMDFHEHVS